MFVCRNCVVMFCVILVCWLVRWVWVKGISVWISSVIISVMMMLNISIGCVSCQGEMFVVCIVISLDFEVSWFVL